MKIFAILLFLLLRFFKCVAAESTANAYSKANVSLFLGAGKVGIKNVFSVVQLPTTTTLISANFYSI